MVVFKQSDLDRKETMEQHAHAEVQPSSISHAGRPFSVQVAATAEGVAAADQAHLVAALEGFSWERRGFLRTLARRPRLRPAPPVR
jgi:hypothetical protein